MNLHEFLRLPRGWAWGGVGGDDCTTFCASWVEAVTGRDPAAGLRGTYCSNDEAAAIIRIAGGIEKLVGSRVEALGFRRVQYPEQGDVGIVRCLCGADFETATTQYIPAVVFGPCVGGHLWAVMGKRGPQVKRLEFSAVWRAP